MVKNMKLRKYIENDCEELMKLFYDTVHSVNAKDYTEEQLYAWANGKYDFEKRNRQFLNTHTVVAVDENVIVGFGNIDESGYLDMLYVHKDFQKRGTATLICNELESFCKSDKITSHASITAKPFFLKRGYREVKEQTVERNGVYLKNFVMVKVRKI